MIEVYFTQQKQKGYIIKSKVVSFFALNDTTTMVWMDGYFSNVIQMNYKEFAKLMSE